LCTNPEEVLCDSNVNPYVAKAAEARELFNQLEEKVRLEPEVLMYIRSRPLESGQKGEDCSDLRNIDDYVQCAMIRTKYLKRYIYTPERSAVATKFFEQAQADLISYLTRRMELLPAMGAKQAVSMTQKMIAKIKATKLYLGQVDEQDHRFEFNAYQIGVIPSTQRTFWKRITGSTLRDYVYIEGYILFADSVPQALYQTMVHELGHVIDGTDFPSSDDGRNPFARDYECLRRSDSVDARRADIACYEEKLRLEESRNEPYRAKLYRRAIAEMRANPLALPVIPDLRAGEQSCQMDQLNEAFSDWLSAEVFAFSRGNRMMPKGGGETKNSIESRDSVFQMVAIRCNKTGGSTAAEMAEKRKDSHPLSSDRINKIIMASPMVRGAIGCFADSVYVPVRNLNQLPQANTIGMCGMWQYLPLDIGGQ